jgi:hypothetical protein
VRCSCCSIPNTLPAASDNRARADAAQREHHGKLRCAVDRVTEDVDGGLPLVGPRLGVRLPVPYDDQQPLLHRALGPHGVVAEAVREGVPVAAEPVGQGQRTGAAVHQAGLVRDPVEVERDRELCHLSTVLNDL